ncbi:MAG: ABC transporter permease, partial [Rhizobiaceae bacterium]|nr:ABC transporter permease [Rhizobiaceae bacterium]
MALLVFPAALLVFVLLVLPMAGLFRMSLNLYSP